MVSSSGKPDFSNRHANHRQQVEPLLSLYQDGEANSEERRTVEYYLARCDECRALLGNFQQVENDLRGYLQGVAAPRLNMALFRPTDFFLDPAVNRQKPIASPAVIRRGNLTMVPPLAGGGHLPVRRVGLAARFGGTLAACALLAGVVLLLILSIQSLNKPPQFTTDVAVVAPSPVLDPTRVEASPTSQDDTTTVALTTQTTNNSQPTTQTNSVPTSPRSVVATTTISGIVATAALGGVGPVTTSLPTIAVTTNLAKTFATTPPPANTSVAPANTTLVTRPTTSAPIVGNTSPFCRHQSGSYNRDQPVVVTSPSVTAATVAPTETTMINNSTTVTTIAPTTNVANPIITDVPTTSVVVISTPSSGVASSAAQTTKPNLVTPVTMTATATSAPAATTAISGTTTLAVSATAIDTPKTTPGTSVAVASTLVANTTAPVNLVSPPVHAPGLLAYVSSKDGDIHLVASDGGNDHLLTKGTSQIMWQQLVWSPDARWLAAVGRAGGINSIYLLDTTSTSPDLNPVIEGVQPVWSPNSRMLAYLANVSVEAGVRMGKSRVIDLKHRTVTHLNNVVNGFCAAMVP